MGNIKDVMIKKAQKKEIINNLLKYCCKIKIKNKSYIGFLCKFPFPDEYYSLKVLIINKFTNFKDIENNSNLLLIPLDNTKEKIYIELDDSIILYTSKEFNMTAIQIREKEEKISSFLEVDSRMNETIDKINDNYINQKLYILNYSTKNYLYVSEGTFNTIKNNDLYFSSKNELSSIRYSNLIIEDDLKIIGILSE